MKNRIAALVLLASIGVAACGSGSSTSTTAAADTTVVAGNADFNDADVMFAQMMIPHHEQAIEMSDIALDPTVGASSAITALATQIKGAQDPEIVQMRDLLQKWGKSESPDDMMDHSSMMKGMLSVDELDALGMLRGSEFDAAWAKAMIAHHEGAIDMAEAVLDDGTNAAIRELAESIVSAQKAEIATLTPLAGS